MNRTKRPGMKSNKPPPIPVPPTFPHRTSSTHFHPAAAPTSPLALALDVNDDIHPSALERLRRPFADIFFVGAAGGDDVYHAEDARGRV